MMKKSFIFLIVMALMVSIAAGATLETLTFSATQGLFQAKLTFNSKPSYELKSVLGNSPVLVFDGNVSSKLSKTIEWGPVKATISSTSNKTSVKFDFPFVVSSFVGEEDHSLVLSFVTLGISQKLALSGAATRISIDFSGENGSTLGLAIKYLARLLKRNLIIDPKISKNPVNITLSNVTPSEAFYDVLISSPGIGYAILPDGTYYIAKESDLVKDLGKLGVGTYNNIVSFYDLSKTNISFADFKSLVDDLFGNDRVIGFLGAPDHPSYAIVKATQEQQKTIKSLMNFLKESTNFSTVNWTTPAAEAELQKLVNTMYPNVKFMYLPSFSTIVLSGSKSDLEMSKKVIEKYAQILSENGPRVSVTFEVPNSNVPAFLQLSKETPGITAYGSPSQKSSNTVYIVNGPQKQMEKFEQNVKLIASTLTVVKAKPLHFNFVMWTDKNSVTDLMKMINILYPDVKIVYFPSFGQILFYSQDSEQVDKAVEFVKSRKPFQTVKVKKTTVTVKISPQNLGSVNAFLKSEFPTLFGTGTRIGTSETIPYVVSGPATDVNEFINALKTSNLIVGNTQMKTPKVEENVVYLKEVPWSDEKSAQDILNLISIKYPNLKAEYLKALKEFAIYGIDSDMINEAAKFINSHAAKKGVMEKKPLIKTEFVKISSQNYYSVESMIKSKGLRFFGPATPSTVSTYVTVGISGAASEVNDTVELLKSSNLLITPSTNATQTAQASPNQIVVVHDDLISCDVKNYPLNTLIEKVYNEFSKNVVFAATKLPNVSLKLSNVTLNEFQYAMENAYKLSFSGTNVIVVEDNSAGITRVYMSSDDVNEVKSMAEFVGGKTFVDQKKGIVVVSNLTPTTAKNLDSMVEPLLTARKDVEIEAKIMDVNANNNITNELKGTLMTPQLIFNNDLTLNLKLLDISNVPKFLTDFADRIISSNATIVGNFSNTTGNASTLSAPVVTTQSGEPANILIGSKYPYMVTTVANGQQQQQLKFLDTGIQLTITPVILPNKKISLTITIEVSDADWAHAVNGIPAVNTRSASMKVVVSSGQTLMIGGLTKHVRSQNVIKIPFLGDLPFIGQFFRTTTFQDSTSNLDIFITAKVEE